MYTAIVSVLVALATVASARYTSAYHILVSLLHANARVGAAITTGFGVCYVNPTTSTTVGGPAATTTIDLPLTTTTSVTYWVYPTNAVEEKRGAVTTIYVAGGCSSTCVARSRRSPRVLTSALATRFTS
jgi:hypothetical protein